MKSKEKTLGQEAPRECCERFQIPCSIAAIKRFANVNLSHDNSKSTLTIGEKRKPSLRSRILELARQPDSIFLDSEEFCKELGIDYPCYRGYVKALRFHPGAKQ